MKNTILIVDDSKDSRELIKHHLKEFKDCRLLEAENGKIALKIVKKIIPDLILLDIVMPVMDGLECCHLIKEKPTMWETPIIMVTAVGKGEGLQQTFDAGAMDYVRKPVEQMELLARVRSALNLNNAITKLKSRTLDWMKTAQSLETANQKLQQLSLLDSLTGIANRRYFDEVSIKEWRRTLREQKPLSLIMADIDAFKKYNDNFGHQAGDDCLKQVAQAMEKLVNRPGDLALYRAKKSGGNQVITENTVKKSR